VPFQLVGRDFILVSSFFNDLSLSGMFKNGTNSYFVSSIDTNFFPIDTIIEFVTFSGDQSISNGFPYYRPKSSNVLRFNSNVNQFVGLDFVQTSFLPSTSTSQVSIHLLNQVVVSNIRLQNVSFFPVRNFYFHLNSIVYVPLSQQFEFCVSGKKIKGRRIVVFD
jgi:hypothetical protein